MFGSSRSGGARRRSTRTRVLVGLSPVLLLGGLVAAEKVSALGGDPQFAGSAVALPNDAAVALATAEPRPDTRSRGEVTPVAGAADRADAAAPQQTAKQQLLSAPSPVAPAAVNRPDDVVPAVLPDERRREFRGWRVVVGQEFPSADDRPEGLLVEWRADEAGLASQSVSPEPAAILVPQPTWKPAPPAPRPERVSIGTRASGNFEDRRQESSSMNLEPEPALMPGPALTAEPADGMLDRARVVIHRPRGDGAPDAQELLGRLNARGAGKAEVRTVGVNVSRPDIRYFHPGDRAIAEEVRSMLRRQGYSPELRDFTDYRPQPSRGSVEVWLPG